uniref:Galectin n=1 Tax=Cyclopterus lumpus TaxID=8103 RepID=A0A8C2XM05_CYCLU
HQVIPFAGTILGGLLPGEMVLIQGSVLRDADRFQVDLTCGSSMEPRADVAFHFNPRFRTPCVVCNALQGGRWGREEVLDLNPFRAGDPFELIVLVLKDTFKVRENIYIYTFPSKGTWYLVTFRRQCSLYSSLVKVLGNL